jgi:hypothetical protein
MSADNAVALNERFGYLIATITLADIRCIAFSSRRLGDPPAGVSDAPSIEISQARGTDDPLHIENAGLLFRTKFDVKVSCGGVLTFVHSSEFHTGFEIKDTTAFEESWKDDEAKAMFFERQLKRTLWPFLREQVQGGMLRLGLAPATLPWIF